MKIKYKPDNKKKKILMISIILLLLTAFGILSYNYIKEDSTYFYDSVAKVIGFVVEEVESTVGSSEPAPEPEVVEEITEPEEQQTTESTAEETIVPEENITEGQEINITIPEENFEPAENITNITIPETIENVIEINETLTNITIPEENITIINETIINETLVNETIITENITAFNITTRQYKAVVNRRVKWIKTFKVDKTESGNLTLEIPKQATNVTVRTGQEVQEALSEIENYEKIIEQADRENIAEGTITGYASYDIEKSRGILTRLIEWLRKLTITGNVIQENELQEEITEKQDTKEIDLTNIIEQAGEQDEIGVEYYTDAPISEETDILRGKQVIVSGPDELNYTEVLAYTILDNRIPINNTDKIKIYWVREEIQGQVEEEITPAQEEIEEPITEEANETTEIEENQTTGIINETEQPINNSSAEINNLTDIKNIIEDNTKNKEEKTSPITAFAVKDKEKNNKDNETEQSIDNSSAELDNLTDIGGVEELEISQTQSITRTIREEVNFTAYDLDEDGMIDYIEWNVPHLSNQTYEIIYITKAEHLDENYTFIKDVYEQVKALDDNWTLIPNSQYIRVTFEKPLDKTKDITIYARVKDNCSASENENNSIINSIMINGTEVPCDIYQKKKRIDEIRRLMGE